MEERPILFNASMVRAILEGRKTQTRRIVKPKHIPLIDNLIDNWENRPFPYGKPSDRFWVKETWAQDLHGEIFYAADYLNNPSIIEKWKPSIFMPRKIARILLEISNIRVERLQEMTEGDAKAEGVYEYSPGHGTWWAKDPKDGQGFGPWGFAKGAYSEVWESINGKDSWDKNPWVWVIEFKRIEGVR